MKTKLEVPRDRVKDKLFIYFWEQFSSDLAMRINVKDSHLQQLKMLCDQMVEYEVLKRIVESVGYTYEYQGSYKERPELKLKNNALGKIVQYSTLLNIRPFKDSSTAEGTFISDGQQQMEEDDDDEF